MYLNLTISFSPIKSHYNTQHTNSSTRHSLNFWHKKHFYIFKSLHQTVLANNFDNAQHQNERFIIICLCFGSVACGVEVSDCLVDAANMATFSPPKSMSLIINWWNFLRELFLRLPERGRNKFLAVFADEKNEGNFLKSQN